ncbi:MAG: hypothetical protein HQL63_01465 [Magnetococcales bacterium]|nr:hypothetical protein [Magnetococcales bacterium]MBF0321915.1 hypothetical protein [Magnetococcales bacterium]
MWSVSQAGMAVLYGTLARQRNQGSVVQKASGTHGREPQRPQSHQRSTDDERSDFHSLFLRALEDDDTE